MNKVQRATHSPMQGPYRAISTPRKLKSKGKTAFQTSSASSFAVTEGLESIRTDKETDLKVGLEDHGYVGRHPEGSKQTPTHNDEGWADKLPTSITPMQFLASMFPALLETTLEDALSQNNGDVERTVECLLSGQGDCSDDTSSLCSSSDFSLGEGPFRFDDSASSSTNHSSTSKSSSLMEHEFPNGCTGNDVETLSGMFPNHNRLTILSTLRTHDFDMDRAADTLSRLAIEDGSAFRQREDDHTLATLIEIFPDNDVSKLQSALRRRGGLEGAIEELTAVKNPKWKSKCEGGCLIDGYPCVIHAQARSVPTTSTRIRAQNKRSARSGASSPLLVIDGRGSSVPATPRMSPGDEDEDEELLSLPSSVGTRQIQAGDPKEFRQLAQHYREKRNDAFRRAATAYRKGDLTGKGSAAYYSEEGRTLTEEVAKWNNLAALTAIQRNKARHQTDPYTVDLHDLTVAEAVKYVHEAVNEWYSREGSCARPARPLKIITGAGHHSSQGVRKLYPACFRSLKKQGWNVVDSGNPGWFLVKP